MKLIRLPICVFAILLTGAYAGYAEQVSDGSLSGYYFTKKIDSGEEHTEYGILKLDKPYKFLTKNLDGQTVEYTISSDIQIELDNYSEEFEASHIEIDSYKAISLDKGGFYYCDSLIEGANAVITPDPYNSYYDALMSLIDRLGYFDSTDVINHWSSFDRSGVGYAKLIDFDNDGNSELVVCYSVKNVHQHDFYFDVYAADGNTVKLVLHDYMDSFITDWYPEITLTGNNKKNYLKYGLADVDGQQKSYYTMENGRMVLALHCRDEISNNSEKYYIDGKEVSKSEYNSTINKYEVVKTDISPTAFDLNAVRSLLEGLKPKTEEKENEAVPQKTEQAAKKGIIDFSVSIIDLILMVIIIALCIVLITVVRKKK